MTTSHNVEAIREQMNLSRPVIEGRKHLVGLDEEETSRLKQLDQIVEPHVDELVEEFCQTLSLDGGAATVAPERDRGLLRQYFGGLTGMDAIGDDFVDRRLELIDQLYEQVSADAAWFLAAHHFYLQAAARLLRAESLEAAYARELHEVLRKVLFFDLGLAVDAYVFERDRTINAQRRELERLSTPVLQLREGLLLLPIIGSLDSARAQQLTEQLLHAVRDNRARAVVLDVTGVGAVDSRVANHLSQTVQAVKLMGAGSIVTGLSPEVAQTLVGLGIELGQVRTMADLQSGLEAAEELLGAPQTARGRVGDPPR